MKPNEFNVKARVWVYSGPAAWHFVSIPKKISAEIKHRFGDLKHGWGSLPVLVTLGKTKWKTSIFPDTKLGLYLLPLKLAIRKQEAAKVNDIINLQLIINI